MTIAASTNTNTAGVAPPKTTHTHTVYIYVPYTLSPIEAVATGLIQVCIESARNKGYEPQGYPKLNVGLANSEYYSLYAEVECVDPSNYAGGDLTVRETKEGLFVNAKLDPKLALTPQQVAEALKRGPSELSVRLVDAPHTHKIAESLGRGVMEEFEKVDVGGGITNPDEPAPAIPEVAHFGDELDVENEGRDVKLDDYMDDEA